MTNSNLVNKALVYIRNHFSDENIDLNTIAKNSGFSVFYFDKLFLENTGMTVMDYTRKLRMLNAALLLRKTDRPITAIALECGYETGESFSKAFKRYFNLIPTEYRRQFNRKVSWFDLKTGAPDIRLTKYNLPLRQIPLYYAITYIKSKNLIENALNAETFQIIPTTVYTLSDEKEPEDFVCLCEYRPEEFAFFIVADSALKYANYIRMLYKLPGVNFELMYDRDITEITDFEKGLKYESSYYLNYVYNSEAPAEYMLPVNTEACLLTSVHIQAAEKYSKIYQPKLSEMQDDRLGSVLKLKYEKNYTGDDFAGTILNGALIAWTRLTPVEGTDFVDVVYIETAEPYRRKGYGNLLLRFCVNHILSKNKTPYYSGIESDNTASLKNCVKSGFSYAGKRWFLKVI